MRKDEIPGVSRYRFPYPALGIPDEDGDYRVTSRDGVLVYYGSSRHVARLLVNSGRHQLVPVGETMETMP